MNNRAYANPEGQQQSEKERSASGPYTRPYPTHNRDDYYEDRSARDNGDNRPQQGRSLSAYEREENARNAVARRGRDQDEDFGSRYGRATEDDGEGDSQRPSSPEIRSINSYGRDDDTQSDDEQNRPKRKMPHSRGSSRAKKSAKATKKTGKGRASASAKRSKVTAASSRIKTSTARSKTPKTKRGSAKKTASKNKNTTGRKRAA